MIIGQTLVTEVATGTTYFSHWFPRQGNAATFSSNVIAVGADLDKLQIQVQTKALEESDGSAVDVGGNQTITLTANSITKWDAGAIDLGAAAAVGFKELVRFKYTLSASVSPSNLPAWVHFRMLNPSWLTD